MTTVTVCVPVSVTAEDIAAGIPRAACHCVVAKAMQRALPGQPDYSIAVWPDGAHFGRVTIDRVPRGPLPARLGRLALAFDRGDAVDPCDDVIPLAFGTEGAARAFCQRNGLDYETAVAPQQATEAA